MNKITLGVLSFIFSIISCHFEASGNQIIKLSFNEQDFLLKESSNGITTIESVKEIVGYPEANEPGLPFLTKNVVLSTNQIYKDSSVKFRKRLIKENIEVEKSPTPIISDSTNFDFNPEPYKSANGGIFPMSNCKYSGCSNWSEFSLCHFLATPFVYDSEEKKLYFIDEIELEISTTNGQQKAQNQNINYLPQIYNEALLKESVVNEDVILSALDDRRNPIDGINTPIEYVIITTKNLQNEFTPLVRWKTAKGVPSTVISIEEISKQFGEERLQVKIKKCLMNLFRHNGLKYVLLGGDDTVVPVQGCYGIVNNNSNYEDFSIPTDLFYSCFLGDFEWDANGNEIYGEIDDNVNLVSQISLSRVPIRTKEEAKIYVSKQLVYETSPRLNNNMLMSGTKLWSNLNRENKSDAEVKGDNLFNNYIKPYWNGERKKFYDTYTDFVGGPGYDFTSGNFKSQIMKGYHFVDVMTHGAQTMWAMELGAAYDVKQGQTQLNFNNTIITTMSCLTNAFDSSEKGGKKDPCLSEALIRSNNCGVIAYLGCSRYGWCYHGSRLGSSLQYEAMFYKNLFSSTFENKNYGTIVAFAKSFMAAQCYDYGSMRWIQFGLNPIGDPEMPIYTTVPKKFDNLNIFAGSDSIRINTDINGCRICVMSSSDYGRSYYKVFNNINSLIIPTLPYDLNICVTKQNYIPKLYKISYTQNDLITQDENPSVDIQDLQNIMESQPKMIAQPRQEPGIINSKTENRILSCSPNPTSGIITVSLQFDSQINNGTICVTNLMGSIEKSFPVAKLDTTFEIDVSDLHNGIHILSLFADNILVDSFKIIKE